MLYDTSAPTVKIAGPTSHGDAPFRATFTFSKVVRGFELSDIQVGNGTASALTETTAGTVWTARITPAGDGAVTLDMPAGAARDEAGNGNIATRQVSLTSPLGDTWSYEIFADTNPLIRGGGVATEIFFRARFQSNVGDLTGLSMISSSGSPILLGLENHDPANVGFFEVTDDTEIGEGLFFTALDLVTPSIYLPETTASSIWTPVRWSAPEIHIAAFMPSLPRILVTTKFPWCSTTTKTVRFLSRR